MFINLVFVTVRKRRKAQMSRRERTVCDLLDSAYIRGSKAKERRRREEDEGRRVGIYIYKSIVTRVLL